MGQLDETRDDMCIEHYRPPEEDMQTLAQRLHEEGLIYAINRLVLHPLGLALGVSGVRREDDPHSVEQVTSLFLAATPDPEGFEYEPADEFRQRARAKLEAAINAQREPARAVAYDRLRHRL